ncbi:hypothetical protein MKX01_000785, partial [Papaver californicum]
IEDKLIDERSVTAHKNDSCKRYKFGDTKPPVIKIIEIHVAILDAISKGEVEDV